MDVEPVAPEATVPVAAWLLPTVVALVLGVVSALATPLMGLPDEPAHAVYAAAVAHGDVVGEDRVLTDPATGWTRTDTRLVVPRAYADLPNLPTCFAFQPEVSADCAPDPSPAAGSTVVGSSTVGTYAPAWYGAVGWPSLLLYPTAALVAMRVVAALLFSGLVGVAGAALARAGGRRWAWVGLAVALPPVAVHLGGGINPSGTEIAGATALWAASAALVLGARCRADVARWVVAAGVVGVVRPLGPAIVVGVAVVAIGLLGHVSTHAAVWDDRRVRRALPVVAVALFAGLGWSLWRGTLSAFSGFPVPEATGITAVRRSLALVPERLAELVGVLGWADVSLPMALVGSWLVAALALAAAGLAAGDTRARAWLLALGVVVLALPIAADVRSAPSIGFVWQGRYTLPVAAGVPLLGGLLLDRTAVGHRWRAPAACLLALWGLGHLVALVAVLRRFRVGVDGAVIDALQAPGTHVEVAGWLLVGVACLAAATPAVGAWLAPFANHRRAGGRLTRRGYRLRP